MGFWSSVSSFCSSVSSFCSSVSSSISKAVSTIVSLGVDLATKVGEAIKGVAVSLGILKLDDNLEELGEKAILSDKKPDDFDSINEYIDHLRNDVPLDKEKFDKLSDKELLERSAVGAAITLKGINEKLDTVVTPEFMAEVAKQDLETEEIVETIKAYKDKELNTEDYGAYLNDELNIDDSDKHSDALVLAYQKLEPELTFEQIEDKVMDLKG